MANPPPMLPGLGFPVDSEIDLLRKWTWNTWLWAQEDFQPEDIPGLGLDLDASYGVLNSIGPDVPATEGQTVRRWLDKSGNGNHFDQSAATNQPAFSAAGFGGVSCVAFDGVDDRMVLGAYAASNVSCFVVLNFIGPYTASQIALSSDATTYWAARGIGDSVAFRPGVAAMRGGPCGSARHIFSTVKEGGAANCYVEGSEEFATAAITPAFSGASYLGSWVDGTAAAMCNIARVLVWPRALTAPELAQVHAYLSQTYGIPLAP